MRDIPTYSPGDPLTAAGLNKAATELKRLARIKGVPPIQVTTNAQGLVVSLSDLGHESYIAETDAGGGSYPLATDGCNMFPMKLYPQVKFDDSDCANTIELGTATAGDPVSVFNLAGAYIPVSTDVIVWKINGQFYCEWYPPPVAGSLRFVDRSYSAGETIVYGEGDAIGGVTILPIDGTLQVPVAGLYWVEFDASAWYADTLTSGLLLPPLPGIALWQMYLNGSSVGVDGQTRFMVPYLYVPTIVAGTYNVGAAVTSINFSAPSDTTGNFIESSGFAFPSITFNPIYDGGDPVPQPACGSFALSITLAANDTLSMKYESGPTVWLDHSHFRAHLIG